MLTEDIMYDFSDFAAIRRIINPTTLLKRECRTRKELEKESAGEYFSLIYALNSHL